MVLGAFVTYVSRLSCAAQPRTSRVFLRAGAEFGGVSSSSAVLLAGCRSGGRVTRVALSPLCSRLKPLLIHTGPCAHMYTLSLKFYHTHSTRVLQHSTTHRSEAAHTRARKKTRRVPRLFITAAATATRMATRPGILVASVDHELEDSRR